ALVLFWPHVERQVRIEGTVAKTSRELSEEYFHSRPRGSQIGAAVSQQSATLSSRDKLTDAVEALENQLAGAEVPLPDCWGGYRVHPNRIEFWQGRQNRLHDRLSYERHDSRWTVRRLAP
ncbi:MAG: pyridoxal 5'-phosphate synthase, partial [Planctomycetales bacterium]|nr:pyridoxal 5'-phosphate synthase [Planctomycetales bacterium]